MSSSTAKPATPVATARSRPATDRESDRGTLRIAMMCESDSLGGAEMVILRLAEALTARGHTVIGVGPDEATQPDRGSNGWLRARFGEAGWTWRTYRKRFPIDPLCVRQLATIMREVGADVVHSHEFGMAVYGTAAARRAGVPHVVSMHGNRAMTSKWTRRVALRWAMDRSRATVAVSEGTRQHLDETLGLTDGRVRVIVNGVPERPGDRTAGRAAVGVRDDELLVLAVGSLIPRKGHLLLIQALESLPGAWRLAIAGTGTEREALEAYARERGLADRVRLLGPREDIPDLMAAADVFAMPSLWEGLPLAVLEAMFAARPIVASAIAGIPEAIEDGKEGLLVPASDVPALRDALGRLLRDASLRERLGGAARARARRDFSIDVMTDAYERLYRGDV